MKGRPCPRCRTLTSRKRCPVCNASLRPPKWQLTAARIRSLRALAHSRKGLDDETYHLRLQAVGVTSTTDLTRELYYRVLAGLRALPDAPAWLAKQRGRVHVNCR